MAKEKPDLNNEERAKEIKDVRATKAAAVKTKYGQPALPKFGNSEGREGILPNGR